ncbi:MAG: hypothetical protein ACYC25_02080 [Paludibacter sp.]
MLKKKHFFILILIFFSFNFSNEDVQILYKKGTDQIKLKNNRESNKFLVQAFKLKRHPQIAFWISYNFALLNLRDSCVKYLILTESIQPQPLSDFYLKNSKKISEWIQKNDEEEVHFIGTLNKGKKDTVQINSKMEDWSKNEESYRYDSKEGFEILLILLY